MKKELQYNIDMHKWPEIEQFRHVAKRVQSVSQFIGKDDNGDPIFDSTRKLPSIEFCGTVKLHGTNAAVTFENGVLSCQSRERIITTENDNAGFAKFIAQPNVTEYLVRNFGHRNIAIYGEWAGKGVQSGVAISNLPKAWYIFGAKDLDKDEWLDVSHWDTDISLGIYNIHRFKTWSVVIDFENPQPSLDTINNWTQEVEDVCPVGAELGVNGVGEGIVWSPVDPAWMNDSRMIFKTKGTKHSEKIKKEATIDPIKSANVQAFVERHAVEERFIQGWNYLKEMNHSQDEKSTGHFIKWVVNDIHKEAHDELVASGLSEKDVNSALSTSARKWFFTKINQ
jgi:hypothetical protein